MTGRRSQSLAQLDRDAALARVSRVRRWTLVAAAALTAGFAALVSAIAPGHSLGAKTRATAQVSTRQAPRTSSRPRMPALASAADLGLQGPSSSPQPAPSSSPSSSPAPSDQSQAVPNPAQAAPVPAPSQAPVVSGGS